MALDDKINELGRMRDLRLARFGASAIPAMAAAQTGGIGAAKAIAKSFHPQRPAVQDKAKLADQQRRIIDSMGDLSQKVRAGDVGLAEALSKQGDYIKEMLEFTQGVYGSRSGAAASTKSSMNSAFAKMSGDMGQFISKSAEQQLGAAGTGGGRAFNEMMDLVGGAMAPEDPRVAQIVARQMASLPVGQRAAFAAHVDAELQRTQGPSANIGTLMEQAAGDGSIDAEQALSGYQQIRDDVSEINKNALITGMAAMNAMAGQIGQSALSTDEAKQLFQDMIELPGMADSPEDMRQRMEAVFDTLPDDANKDTIDQYMNLLDSMDTETPPANVEEARRRLFASQEFQDFKAANNLTDDMMALKLRRRQLRDEKHAGRQRDRQVIAAQKAGMKGPQPISDDLVSAPADEKQPDTTVPTFVSDGEKLFVYDPSDGSFEEADADDLIKLDSMLSDEKTGMGVAEMMVGPDRFDEFKSMSDQSASKSLIDDARERAGGAEAVQESMVPKKKTIGTAIHAVGHGLTHPASGIRGVQSAVGDLIKNRKKTRDKKAAEDAMSRGIGAGMSDTGLEGV